MTAGLRTSGPRSWTRSLPIDECSVVPVGVKPSVDPLVKQRHVVEEVR